MIYLRFLLLLILNLFFNVYAADADTSSEPRPLFKIGFEFQESHHMCPWAIGEQEIQSKPIFSVCQGGRILWDITIDWQDLEFATMPIASHEMDILQATMRSIQIACDALIDLNKRADSAVDVTFKKWVKHFGKLLQGDDDPVIRCLSIQKKQIFSLSLGSFKFPVPYGSEFSFEFQPQVTIQHHLCDSINLCLGLFVEDAVYPEDRVIIEVEKTGILKDFVRNTNLFRTKEDDGKSVSFQKRTTPQEGFLFLHIITCIDLSREKRPDVVTCGDLDITRSTKQTQTMCLLHFGGGQVNAKSSVNFLSRRPFSSMWKVIAPDENYSTFLRGKVGDDFLPRLEERFEQVNYGEIFFTEEGEIMNLTQCSFLRGFDDPNVQFLLERGILTLEFIKIIDPELLKNYFEKMLHSISAPEQVSRCVFDRQTKKLTTTAVTHDLLSPPHLTSEKDAMGAFKDDLQHDKKYGEAIVEFRGISDIPESVLKRIAELVECEDEPEMKNNFLSQDFSLDVKSKVKRKFKNDQYDLQTQAEGLFLYITALLTGRLS